MDLARSLCLAGVFSSLGWSGVAASETLSRGQGLVPIRTIQDALLSKLWPVRMIGCEAR